MKQIILIIILTFILFPIFYYFILKKKENFQNIENNENIESNDYIKYQDTLVSLPLNPKSEPKKFNNIYNTIENLNLDQCKKKCNESNECVGFVRKKTGDLTPSQCSLIKNVINCHNEYKEVSPKYTIPLSKDAEKFYNYDTYFKSNLNPKQKDNILKCVKLNSKFSLMHHKFPFGYLLLDNNNNLKVIKKDLLVPNKKDETDVKIYSKKGVFEIVKGLTGSGVSFKMNKFDEDYYLVYNYTNEYITSKIFDDSYNFRESATFEFELEISEDLIKDSEEVRYVSIIQNKKGNKLYWKLNETTNKVIVSTFDNPSNKENLLFEIVSPLEYEKEIKEENTNEPAISNEIEEVMFSPDETTEKDEELLDSLELDIRETQNKQNLKLMNIMLDVNKFKLHDLSMNNFLSKCVRTSGDNINNGYKIIDEKFKNEL